jgi:hypothetical protein
MCAWRMLRWRQRASIPDPCPDERRTVAWKLDRATDLLLHGLTHRRDRLHGAISDSKCAGRPARNTQENRAVGLFIDKHVTSSSCTSIQGAAGMKSSCGKSTQRALG